MVNFLSNIFENSFFSVGNLNNFKNALNIVNGLGNMFVTQRQRSENIQKYFAQAQQYETRAMEEDYKYKMINSTISLKSELDRKNFLARSASAGLEWSGSILDISSQIRNVSINESKYNDIVRNRLVNSLQESSYNYVKIGTKAAKYGIVEDLVNSSKLLATGFFYDFQKGGKK